METRGFQRPTPQEIHEQSWRANPSGNQVDWSLGNNQRAPWSTAEKVGTLSEEEVKWARDTEERVIKRSIHARMELLAKQDEMARCYFQEGLGAKQNCRHLAREYISLLREKKWDIGNDDSVLGDLPLKKSYG